MRVIVELLMGMVVLLKDTSCHLVLSKLSPRWSSAMVNRTNRRFKKIEMFFAGRSNGFIDHPTDGHGWADDLTHDWGNARSSAFLRINATGHLVGQHIEDIGLSNLRLGRQLT